MLKPGQRIDTYQVLSEWSQGGCARLYHVRDIHTGADLALKVPERETLADEELSQRFFQEIYIGARLRHPNVAPVIRTGMVTLSGVRTCFLVMPLYRAGTLRDLLDETGALPWPRAVALILSALRGVEHIHQHGIVHKDLKPENLMLTRNAADLEELVLIDFGGARLLYDTGVTRLSHPGMLFGTGAYMAPEYISSQHVSFALDVYQMGLVLIEMLTGEPLVQGEDSDACMVTQCEGPLALPEHLLDLPIAPILQKTIAFQPGQRFPDATALIHALLSLLRHDSLCTYVEFAGLQR